MLPEVWNVGQGVQRSCSVPASPSLKALCVSVTPDAMLTLRPQGKARTFAYESALVSCLVVHRESPSLARLCVRGDAKVGD